MSKTKIVVSDTDRIVAAILSNTFYVARANERFDRLSDEQLIHEIEIRWEGFCDEFQRYNQQL